MGLIGPSCLLTLRISYSPLGRALCLLSQDSLRGCRVSPSFLACVPYLPGASLEASWPAQLQQLPCLRQQCCHLQMRLAVPLQAAVADAACNGGQHSQVRVPLAGIVAAWLAVGCRAAVWACAASLLHLQNLLVGPGPPLLQQGRVPACGTARLQLQTSAGPRQGLVLQSAGLLWAVRSYLRLVKLLVR